MPNGRNDNPNNLANQMQPQLQRTVTQRTGTGFTNINKYLRPSSQNTMGQRVSQGIGNQIGQVKSSFDTAQQNLQQGINQASAAADKDQYQSIFNKAIENPNALTEEDVNKFSKGRDLSYNGPSETDVQSSFTPIQQQVQKAQALAKQSNTQQGRESLVKQYLVNNPTAYTAGKNALDQLLLGKLGQKQIAQSTGQVGTLQGQVNASQQGLLTGAQQAQQKTLDLVHDLNANLESRQQQLTSPAQQKANEAKARDEANIENQIRAFLGENIENTNPSLLRKDLSTNARIDSGSGLNIGKIAGNLFNLSGRPQQDYDSFMKSTLSNLESQLQSSGVEGVKNNIRAAARITPGQYEAGAYATPEQVAQSIALARLQGNANLGLKAGTPTASNLTWDINKLLGRG